MDTFSIGQILLVAFLLFVFIAPAITIAQKAGRSGWWALLMLIPVVNIAAIWVFAYVRWPALEPREKPAE